MAMWDKSSVEAMVLEQSNLYLCCGFPDLAYPPGLIASQETMSPELISFGRWHCLLFDVSEY